LLGEILAYIKKENISIKNLPIDKERISELIILFDNGKITNINAKKIFMMMTSDKRTPNQIMNEEKMMILEDDNFLDNLIQNVFKNHENEFNRLKNGEMKLIGFFMGQIMQEAKGKADPQSIQKKINQYVMDQK